MDRAAIILAGGKATRFGEPHKALATLDGAPLISHIAGRVEYAVTELVVSCRRTQARGLRAALVDAPLQPRFAFDHVSNSGPVVGLRAALEVTTAPLAYVTGCDRPLVDTRLVETLFEYADNESAAIPRHDGRRQVLTAVYRRTPTQRACNAVLASGKASLQALADQLDPLVLPEDLVDQLTEDTTFIDINTRTDLDTIARR